MKTKRLLSVLIIIIFLIVPMVSHRVIEADDYEKNLVRLNNWSFSRGGVKTNDEYLKGNEGQIEYVKMDGTNEMITGWKKSDPETQKQSATQLSAGFEMSILKNGWERGWKKSPMYVNPWQIKAEMPDVEIKSGHEYTVSFKAHATKRKYAYVVFASEVEGFSIPPYGKDASCWGSEQIIVIEPYEKTFTYTFVNLTSAKDFTTRILLGNFSPDVSRDNEGNKIEEYYGKFFDFNRKDIVELLKSMEKDLKTGYDVLKKLDKNMKTTGSLSRDKSDDEIIKTFLKGLK